jgi:drug/metabolite transporter (DMT)-like permease
VTTHIATDLKANLAGSGWMIASMAVFAIEDAFIKAASVSLPVGQVLVIFGLGGSLVFASQTSLYALGAVPAGVIAYSCLMKAMRTGEVSAVTPFRYTRLLFGIALGIIRPRHDDQQQADRSAGRSEPALFAIERERLSPRKHPAGCLAGAV